MYVPFGKSVGDVTFRFSLRHHFWPRLKKTMEHNLTYKYLDDLLLINNKNIKNYRSDVSPDLEIKDTTDRNTSSSYLELLLSIGREVNFALPFMTSVTISIYILKTFRFGLATSHLRPPIAFLSHNSGDTPGLAHLMNVYSEGGATFQ